MCPAEPKKCFSPCHCVNFRRAALAVTAVYNDALKPAGVSVNQFTLLQYISTLAPVSVSELSDAVDLDRTTLVRNLKPLEERDLVADIAPRGSRKRQLTVTTAGNAVLVVARPLWRRIQERLEENLGSGLLAAMEEAFLKIEKSRL